MGNYGVRVAYSGFNDQRTQIINELHRRGWNPEIFIGKEDSITNSQLNKYVKVKIDSTDFRIGKYKNTIPAYRPLDSADLCKISRFEHRFTRTLFGVDEHRFGLYQARNFYYECIQYWLDILSMSKIELVVFYTVPHTTCCYSLYIVAKFILGLDVIFIDATPLLNRRFHLIARDLENIPELIIKRRQSGIIFGKRDISENGLNYLNEISNSSVIVHEQIARWEKLTQSRTKYYFFKTALKAILLLATGRGFSRLRLAIKANKRTWGEDRSLLFRWQYEILNYLRYKSMRRLGGYYDRLCTRIDQLEPDCNYFYFSMPFQPEAASNTSVGYYGDLRLTIRLIVSCLPQHSRLLIKEHPEVFNNYLGKATLVRDKKFYEWLNEIPGVILVRTDTPSAALIDKCKATITVNGSASWEAAIRGRFGVVIGSMWYSALDSIFTVFDETSLRSALSIAASQAAVGRDEVESYVAEIEKACIPNMLHHSYYLRRDAYDLKKEHCRIAEYLFESYKVLYSR